MIRTIAILVLLAATAADAQLTTTVKRIRLEHATAAELAGTTLDLGHAVFNEDNPADLRIGDGATPGGIRVGSDWWTNNMLTAWGGLSRVDVEALLALSLGYFQEKDAAALSAVAAVSGRVDTVEGWGDHAEAGYLPLAGHNDPVVLGTSIRGFGATTNVGYYGFAAGENTSAGEYGFAAGYGTSADFAGFAAGEGTSAGDYGFAAGYGTSAGYFGFAAGVQAKGADGSFVFADNSAGTTFNRTNRPNEFSARAAGGVYFDTPMMTVTGTVSAGSFAFGDGNGQYFLNSSGTSWLTLDGTNLMFTATNGVTGRVQMIYE